jgi:hypothetical protein
METTEHQPDQPTPDENEGESTPDTGTGGVPQPATLPSDDPADGDAREGDDEHDEDAEDEQESE